MCEERYIVVTLKNNIAVSEVVSTLLTLMIVLGTVATMLLWGLPYIEERKIKSQAQTSISNFELLYSSISDMIIDGSNSKATASITSTLDKSTLDIDSNSGRLVFFYSFDDGFDFNVTGLDDNNETFKIYMKKGEVDNATISWLDPGNQEEVFFPENLYDSIIYNDGNYNYQCAQSFSPLDSWTLSKVKLYLVKRGYIDTNLTISICNKTISGIQKPPLTSSSISPSKIESYYSWIEFDIDNILLEPDEDYVILANTTGGSCSSGSYNYYSWYLNNENIFNDGNALFSKNITEDFIEDTRYDFTRRLDYLETSPPTKPTITYTTLYSGINQTLTVRATDPDLGDQIKYRLIWGDGNYTDWTEYYGSGDEVPRWHRWAKPGKYVLTAQAIDNNNNINENITLVTVEPKIYSPEDIVDEETKENQNSDDPWSVTTKSQLKGTILIDLFNDTYPNDILLRGKVPFGRIWLYDTGSITFSTATEAGNQQIIFENSGILTDGWISKQVKRAPSFFEGEDSFSFRIIQIEGSSGGGGVGVYKLNLHMNNSYSREPGAPKFYNLKMQFFEPNYNIQELWLDFLSRNYNFTRLKTPFSNPWEQYTIFYNDNCKYLFFDDSYINIEVGGII